MLHSSLFSRQRGPMNNRQLQGIRPRATTKQMRRLRTRQRPILGPLTRSECAHLLCFGSRPYALESSIAILPAPICIRQGTEVAGETDRERSNELCTCYSCQGCRIAKWPETELEWCHIIPSLRILTMSYQTMYLWTSLIDPVMFFL